MIQLNMTNFTAKPNVSLQDAESPNVESATRYLVADISFRLFSSLVLMRFAKMIRKRAPAEHPVYALIQLVRAVILDIIIM